MVLAMVTNEHGEDHSVDQSPYEYERLQGNNEGFHYVRLISLLPAPHRELPLRCEIRHAELSLAVSGKSTKSESQTPDYEVLSYVWGDASPFDRIFFHQGALDIGNNLSIALRRLREGRISRTLWIDAICINQEDVDERNAQVTLMHNIYSQAKQVIIFLGEPNPPPKHWDIKAAFHLTKKLATFGRTLPDLDLRKVGLTRRKFQTLRLGFPCINSGKYAALRVFFTRPWFGRMWVVQEAACARWAIIVRGDHQMAFAEFMKGTEYGLTSGLFLPAHIRKMILPIQSEAPRGNLSSAIAMYRLASLEPQDQGSRLPLLTSTLAVENEVPISLLKLLRRFHGSRATNCLRFWAWLP